MNRKKIFAIKNISYKVALSVFLLIKGIDCTPDILIRDPQWWETITLITTFKLNDRLQIIMKRQACWKKIMKKKPKQMLVRKVG